MSKKKRKTETRSFLYEEKNSAAFEFRQRYLQTHLQLDSYIHRRDAFD